MDARTHGGGEGRGPENPVLRPVPVKQVKLEGELGRRLELTLRRNYLALELDGDFLRPFRRRQPKEKVTGFGRFTGLGMLIHARCFSPKTAPIPS